MEQSGPKSDGEKTNTYHGLFESLEEMIDGYGE